MTKLFTFARTTAVAALALGAGALLIPEPAEAQGRSGFSGGGGRSMGVSGGGGRSMGFSGGGRSMGFAGGGRSMGFAGAGPRGAGFAGPRMAAPRMVYGAGARTYGQRAIASGAYGGRNFAYPTRGYRTAGVTAQHWRHRPGHRPPSLLPRRLVWRLSLLGRGRRPWPRAGLGGLFRERRLLRRRLLARTPLGAHGLWPHASQRAGLLRLLTLLSRKAERRRPKGRRLFSCVPRQWRSPSGEWRMNVGLRQRSARFAHSAPMAIQGKETTP